MSTEIYPFEFECHCSVSKYNHCYWCLYLSISIGRRIKEWSFNSQDTLPQSMIVSMIPENLSIVCSVLIHVGWNAFSITCYNKRSNSNKRKVVFVSITICKSIFTMAMKLSYIIIKRFCKYCNDHSYHYCDRMLHKKVCHIFFMTRHAWMEFLFVCFFSIISNFLILFFCFIFLLNCPWDRALLKQKRNRHFTKRC